MTIEEKAKAYDEAIERANSLLSGNQLGNAWIYKLLPDPKESEDERIRKDIISHFAKGIEGSSFDEVREKYKTWIAWLEKQGEQKPAWSKEDERICCTIVNDIEIDKTMCKYEISKGICDEQINWLKSLKDRVQPQPKQEWSLKEDAFIQVYVNAINDISYFRSEDKEELINWLKSLSHQNRWKPSDEQMKALKEAVDEHFDIDGGALWHLYEDLKKLKD